MKTANVNLPIAPRIIAINDTIHYNISPEDRPYIESIYSVYMYDANSRTFCCEITPYYFLIHLYDEIRFTDAAYVDDSKLDYLDDKYAHCGGEDTYMHCSDLDNIERRGNDSHNEIKVEPDVQINVAEDETRDSVMESLREYYCSNRVI